MKTKRSLNSNIIMALCIAAIMSFTACSGQEDPFGPKAKTPVSITASITGEVVTKADVNKDYAPAEGGKTIALYYKNGANSTATEKGLFTYDGSWSANVNPSAGYQIFWDDLEAVGSAYPFFAVAPADLNKVTSKTVETDQNTGANQTNSDLLMAFTSVAPTNKMKKIDLTFKHMLAKLTVKVDVSKVANASSVTVAVTIKNAISDYTINYTSPSPTTAIPAAVTSGASRKAITPKTVTGTGTIREFSAILPVQDIVKAGTTVEVKVTQGSSDTNTYTFQPENAQKVSLAKAQNTTLTLTIKGTNLELGTIQVTDWTTGTAPGDITIDK